MASSIFPVFIKAQYDGSGRPFESLKADADRTAREVESTFKRMTSSLSGSGIKLNLNTGDLRQAAADADLNTRKLIVLRDATKSLAAANGDTTQATQRHIDSLSKQILASVDAQDGIRKQITLHTNLQSEINQTISSNDRLAQSYRNTFLEQARTENAASRSQQTVNTRAGINIRGESPSAVNNGASFSALEAQAQNAIAAEARVAQALRASAQASQQYETELRELIAVTNPAALAQEKLAQSVALADRAFARGDLNAEQHAQAVTRLSSVYGNMAGTMGVTRQATVQAGQQLQDIGISLYSGQQAAVVFAQQIPQLAFVLSSLEGSANKTQDRIGKFATFLAGPWGLAVGVAAGAVVYLISSLFKSDDAAKASGTAIEKLKDKLDLSKNSYAALIEVVKEYNDAQNESKALTYSAIEAANKLIKANLDLAKSELIKQQALPYSGSGSNASTALYSGNQALLNAGISPLQKRIAELEKQLRSSGVALGDENVKRATDERYRIESDFDKKLETLRQRELKDTKGLIDYEKERLSLVNQRVAALDAFEKRSRGSDRSTAAAERAADRAARTVDFLLPVNGPTTSAFGTRRHPVTGRTAFHGGQDYGVPIGTRVRAPADGVVSEVGRNPGSANGIFVRINHGGGTESTYLHLNKADVVEGQVLTAGEYLGQSGNTGRSTGPHLHEQIKVNGRVVDPRNRRLQVGATGDLQNDIFEKQEAALKELAEFGENAANAIAGISSQFDDQPRLIDASAAATRRLDDIMKELSERRPEGFEQILEAAQRAQALAADAVNRPLREMQQDAAEQAALDQLRINGRAEEAEILERTLALQRNGGIITQQSVEAVTEIVAQERLRGIELEKQQAIQQRNLAIVSQTQDNVRQGLRDIYGGKGFAAIGDGISRQFNLYLDGLADQVSEQLFGETFQKQKLKLLGLDKVDEAGREMATSVLGTVDSLNKLTKAFNRTTAILTGDPVNDNEAAATQKQFDALFGTNGSVTEGLTGGVQEMFVSAQPNVEKTMKSVLTDLMKAMFGEKFAEKISDLLQGAFTGATLGGLVGGRTGQLVGGGLGSLLQAAGGGKLLASLQSQIPLIGTAIAVNQGLNTLFGNDDRKGGKLLHTALGPFASLLFGKKSGSTTLSSTTGDLSYRGSGGYRDGVLGSGGAVQSSLASIIERLGGTEGAFRVSLGQRGKDFTVDPTGAGRTKGSGVLKFKTEADAARAALLDAIKDGAVAGISAGAQRLLQAGKDIEKQLDKALSLQSVFDRLKEIDNPLGAAMDKLDREFSRLRAIATEAGEGLAEVERLYGIERARVAKETNERILASLRGLYDELTISNSALSLRDRKSAAQSIYNPLAERVRAGDTAAYDDFAKAARELLSIERELSGSQGGYFSLLGEVTDLTKARLDAAASPAAANDNAPVVSAIGQLGSFIVDGLGAQLTAVNQNLGALIAQGFGGGGGGNFNFGSAQTF